MTFSLYCLIENADLDLSIDSLASQFQKYFSSTDGYKQEFEEYPFDPVEKNLVLSWGEWWIRVFFECGADVQADAEVISNYVNIDRRKSISEINRRVRIIFASDIDLLYTNHIIFMMDFLRAQDGWVVFDPQKKEIVDG